MAGNSGEVRRILLDAVSGDYEPFESIVERFERENARTGWNLNVNQIKIALLNSIAEDLVEAYLVHSEPPFVTAAEATFDTLNRYWFATTEFGELIRRNSMEGCVFYSLI